MDRFWTVFFCNRQTLVEALMRAKQDQGLPKFIRQLMRYDAFIVDGLGYVQRSREETQALFQLLAECYEHSSVLISSHLPFSKWETIFHDPMTTAAAVDRLVHTAWFWNSTFPVTGWKLHSAVRRGCRKTRNPFHFDAILPTLTDESFLSRASW